MEDIVRTITIVKLFMATFAGSSAFAQHVHHQWSAEGIEP
jgi:hypothetical protein